MLVGQRITTLYGEGGLDTLDYRVVRQDDQYGLLVDARGNSIGPNYVRFGLSLQDDFEGDSYYDAGDALRDVRHHAHGRGVGHRRADRPDLAALDRGVPAAVAVLRLVRHAAHRGGGSATCRSSSGRAERRAVPRATPSTTGSTSASSSATGARSGPASTARRTIRASRSAIPSDPRCPSRRIRSSARATTSRASRYDTLDDINFPHCGQRAMLQWSGERNVVGGEPRPTR